MEKSVKFRGQTAVACSDERSGRTQEREIYARLDRRPGKNGGYPSLASDVSCVPGCRGDSVARHSSFKTWSRFGVGDRLRGSHLDQPKYRYPLSPRFFPVSILLRCSPIPVFQYPFCRKTSCNRVLERFLLVE